MWGLNVLFIENFVVGLIDFFKIECLLFIFLIILISLIEDKLYIEVVLGKLLMCVGLLVKVNIFFIFNVDKFNKWDCSLMMLWFLYVKCVNIGILCFVNNVFIVILEIWGDVNELFVRVIVFVFVFFNVFVFLKKCCVFNVFGGFNFIIIVVCFFVFFVRVMWVFECFLCVWMIFGFWIVFFFIIGVIFVIVCFIFWICFGVVL